MDAASLLGGMLTSSFGHAEPQYHQHTQDSGLGIGSVVAGVAGAAAVGGLGYMAYKHFAQQSPAQPGMMQPGMYPQAGYPGAPPQQPQGGVGGFFQSLGGSTSGLQQGGFSVPGYEYQNMAQPQQPQAQAWQGQGQQMQPAPAPAPAPSEAVPTYSADQYKALPDRPHSPYDDAPTVVPGGAPAPAPAPAQAPAPPSADQQKHALLLVRAMVAAASADGHIDDDERKLMTSRLEQAGASQAERDALEQEMKAPHPIAVLAADVKTPELAEEFYAVSLMSMKMDSEANVAYARMLPLVLRLSPEQATAAQQKVRVTVPT